MNAVRVHGAGELSRRMSLRVEGRLAAMLCRGEEDPDEQAQLLGRGSIFSKHRISSNAEEGCGTSSNGLTGLRQLRDCRRSLSSSMSMKGVEGAAAQSKAPSRATIDFVVDTQRGCSE